MEVCTGYETGALNVRVCPGTECWVKHVLDEGTPVTVSPTPVPARDGGWWVRVISPVEGWVNLKYLCGEKP